MSDWLTKLVAALELETVNDDLLSYVDDILNWGAVRSQSEPYIKLYEELGEQIINERFEELLDRLLVGDCALGQMFPLSLNEEQAKKRYRKLIRIFHPDRGFKSQVWLNYRAERVNKAYQQFLDNEEVQADISLDDFPEEPLSKKSDNGVKTKVGKFAIKPKFRYRSSIWRERLGSPQEFQKKIVSLLLVVSLFLIFAVYFSNKEAETSQALVSSPRASTLHSVQDQSLEEEYIVDSNAKKILQEANAFFSENEKVKVDTQFDSEVSSESELPLNGSVVQLGSFINELNEVTFNLEEHKVESDTCHSYVDLSFTSVINNGENKIKKLLSALSMYSGPSADCVLLEKLTKGTEVYMHAQTKDLMWAKVIIADADRELVGWIDMSKFDTPDSVTKKDKKVNADIGQSVNKPVTRVASSLTKSSRVKKEEL